MAEAFSTDGAIGGNNLVVLQDDKKLFPVYQIAPVIRDDVLAANPDIKTVLNVLAAQADQRHDRRPQLGSGRQKARAEADVAKEFLKNKGLLK